MKSVIAAVGSFAILVGIAPLSVAQQQRLGGEQNQPGVQQERPGQQRQQSEQRQLGGQRQVTGQAGELDEKLAAWLACGNRAEVELGQLAAQKATHPQVRQFAEMMVKDHTQLLQQLKQINPEIEVADTAGQQLGQAARQPGQTAREPGQAEQQRLQQQAQQEQQRPGRSQLATGGAEDQLMEIGKRASERKVELTKAYLQDKQGQEFDKCYIGWQIAAHIGMLAELEAMENAGSPQLQQIVSKASQGTEQHLQQAQQIAQTLEGGEGAAARLSRRPGQPDPLQQRDQPQRDQPQPEQDR
jgi:predicted outer membrane protein